MQFSTFPSIDGLDLAAVQALLSAEPSHPHIHALDFPYRLAASWQDQGCDFGVWQEQGRMQAWAVFQPAWWNLDYALAPAARGSELEAQVLAWGKTQMRAYARRSGEDFYASVELFADTPNLEQTQQTLTRLGFGLFDWSILRFELDLSQELPVQPLPAGLRVRPLQGEAEVEDYVRLQRAAFGSERMTAAWRRRTLRQPAYRPELDLVLEQARGQAIGFCVGWLQGERGQIEPLGIHPDYQGQGLGAALEAAAIQALREHGARLLCVDHASTNERALAMARHNGLRQVNNALRYYLDPNAGE